MEEAVQLCLEKWEALKLALYIHNTQMPPELKAGVLQMLGRANTSVETIQYFLEDFLDEKYAIDLEDGSAHDIASILLSVREELKQNRTDTLDKLRNIQRRPLQNAPSDSSEEELNEQLEDIEIEDEVPELVPDVDEDGFEMVKPKRRRK